MTSVSRLSISHMTRYAFASPARGGMYQARLKPMSTAGQKVESWSVEIEGGTTEAEFSDQYGNHVLLIAVTPGASEIVFNASGVVEVRDQAGITGRTPPDVGRWLFCRQTPLTEPGPAARAIVSALPVELRPNDVAGMHALSAEILGRVHYDTDRTDAKTTAEEAVLAGRGVCQDHAHIFIGLLRRAGVPARYVSGYLNMDDRVDQEAGHAWAEAWVEGLGWVGFDISNSISPDARYARVATGLDYWDAAPLRGLVIGAAETNLRVALQVQQQ